ncbi:MAG: addiction module toxin, HicA family [Candidatus Altiarchaeales archaeon]|nr:addiction module toxin, HicA family [Candidatus Altiarchaeales archaeon]
MSKLKPVSPRKLSKLIEKLGFNKIRQKGSHAFYLHEDGRRTVIPLHSSEDIGVGLLIEILKEIELNRKQYQKQIK